MSAGDEDHGIGSLVLSPSFEGVEIGRWPVAAELLPIAEGWRTPDMVAGRRRMGEVVGKQHAASSPPSPVSPEPAAATRLTLDPNRNEDRGEKEDACGQNDDIFKIDRCRRALLDPGRKLSRCTSGPGDEKGRGRFIWLARSVRQYRTARPEREEVEEKEKERGRCGVGQ